MPPPPVAPFPTPPVAEEGAAASGAVMMAVGLVAGLVIGLILGFVLGRRARNLVTLAQDFVKAVRSLGKKVSAAAAAAAAAPPAPSPADSSAADKSSDAPASGSTDAELVSTKEVTDDSSWQQQPPEIMLASFLNTFRSALDDHGDIVFNPVLQYQMRREQLLMKERRQREKQAQEEGGEETVFKSSYKFPPLKVLEEHGARLTSADAKSSEAREAAERRAQLKKTEQYLGDALDVDVAKSSEPKQSHLVGAEMFRNAMQAAIESSTMTEHEKIALTQRSSAMAARVQLREIQRVRPIVFIPSKDPFDNGEAVRRDGTDLSDELKAELLVEEAQDGAYAAGLESARDALGLGPVDDDVVA